MLLEQGTIIAGSLMVPKKGDYGYIVIENRATGEKQWHRMPKSTANKLFREVSTFRLAHPGKPGYITAETLSGFTPVAYSEVPSLGHAGPDIVPGKQIRQTYITEAVPTPKKGITAQEVAPGLTVTQKRPYGPMPTKTSTPQVKTPTGRIVIDAYGRRRRQRWGSVI